MKDRFYVQATKEGVKYADNYAVCCPINPGKGRSTYSNGVLKVTGFYQQPFENAIDVKNRLNDCSKYYNARIS